MRKKLLAIFSAILVACSLCVVGTSVSALDDNKTAATVVDVNYTDNYAGFAGQATSINFGAASGLADWAEYEDKTCIEYVNAAGEDKLVSLGVQGNYLLINRYAAANVGDVVTLKAGFAWGESEIKEDVSYKFAAVGSPWVKVTEGDDTVNYVDVAVNNVWLYNNTTWGAPTIEVKLAIPAENTLSQFFNARSTVDIEYEKADGSKGNLADFSCANPGEGRFIIRLADNGQADNMYYAENGDKFIIRAGSYVLDGNTAYRVTKDLTYVCEDASNTNGFVLQVNLEDAVSTSVNSVYLYNDATWTKPALQVSLNIPDYTLALGQYASGLAGMTMEYEAVDGSVVNLPEFTYVGSNNFIVRPTVNEGTFAVSVGDKFTIKADSYVADGNGAYAIREDATFIVTKLASGQVPLYKENTITFDANGGVLADEATQTVYTLGTVTEPADPTRAGYKFAGWTLDGAAYNFDTPVVGDITLVAKYTTVKNTYTVTFNANGGVLADDATKTLEYGSLITVTNPTKESTNDFDYVFEGWKADGQLVDLATYTVTGDVELKASWTANRRYYTVTFDANGGVLGSGASELKKYGETVSAVDPTRYATDEYTYTFAGWKVDGEFVDLATYTVTGNVTLVAEWTATKNSYTVTFELNGGVFSGETTMVVEYGTIISRPAAPTKEGYNFVGWAADGGVYLFNEPVTGDITIVAAWSIKTFTVTFDADGGELAGDATATVEYGAAITVTDPTKAGYTFEGWTIDGEEVDLDTYVVTGDVTLVATWEEIPAPAPAPEDKGCGSALVGTLIPSMVALIAAGVVVTSKKKRD